MVGILTLAALASLALGALSGFVLLVAVDSPQRLKAARIVDPVRVRQVHLDWIMMGLVMGLVSVLVPNMSWWVATLILVGGIVNPATFIPMAFSRRVAGMPWFKAVSFVSFLSLTSGLVLSAVQFATSIGR